MAAAQCSTCIGSAHILLAFFSRTKSSSGQMPLNCHLSNHMAKWQNVWTLQTTSYWYGPDTHPCLHWMSLQLPVNASSYSANHMATTQCSILSPRMGKRGDWEHGCWCLMGRSECLTNCWDYWDLQDITAISRAYSEWCQREKISI